MVLGLLGTTYHHLDYYPGTTYCQLDNYLDTTHCHLDYYPGTTYHHLDYYPGTTHCHLDYYPGTTNHHLDYYPAAIYRHRSLIIVSTTTSKVSVHPSVRMGGGGGEKSPHREQMSSRQSILRRVNPRLVGWIQVQFSCIPIPLSPYNPHPTPPPPPRSGQIGRLSSVEWRSGRWKEGVDEGQIDEDPVRLI